MSFTFRTEFRSLDIPFRQAVAERAQGVVDFLHPARQDGGARADRPAGWCEAVEMRA